MALGTLDGSLYSVMVGVGESYLTAFILASGFDGRAAGLMAPLPQFFGAVLGLAVPTILRLTRTVRGVTASLAAGQAVILAAFAVIAALGVRTTLPVGPIAWLYLLASLYWASSYGAGQTWSAWVNALYPRAIRPTYFGVRAQVAQLCVLGGLIAGGLILGRASGVDDGDPRRYAILFAIAAALRFASSGLLCAHSESQPMPRNYRDVSTLQMMRRFRDDSGGRVLIYMLAFSAAVFVAGPFFAAYMLEILRLDYQAFTLLIGANFLSKSLALPIVGRFAKSLGAGTMLWVGAVAVIPLSSLWLVSDSFWWLLAINALAGVAWAFYELSTFLLLFDTIPPGERVGIQARFWLFNSLAQLVGVAIAIAILTVLKGSREAYLTLFALSGLMRLAALPLVARIHPHPFRIRRLILRPGAPAVSSPATDEPEVVAIDEPEPADTDRDEPAADAPADDPRPDEPRPVSSSAGA